MRKYNENPKNFPRLCPKPHQSSALDQLGGSQTPSWLQQSLHDRLLKIVKKKNEQLIFPYFDHWKIANSAKNNVDVSFEKKSTPYPKNKRSE